MRRLRRDGIRRKGLREATLSVAIFVKKYFNNTKFQNYGDVNYVEYGGTQIRFGGSVDMRYAEIYDLSGLDSGYDGWVLTGSTIGFDDIFSNYDPNLPISMLEFSPKMDGVISFVGASDSIEDFYSSGDPNDLVSAIYNILTGINAYGGYDDGSPQTWNIQDMDDEDEIAQVQEEVESDLARMGFDL